MMLRASDSNNEIDLAAAVGQGTSGGDPASDALVALTDAVLDHGESAGARERVVELLGADGLVDAVAVIAHFDAITKIADGAGIELDKGMVETTAGMREQLGINRFASAD